MKHAVIRRERNPEYHLHESKDLIPAKGSKASKKVMSVNISKYQYRCGKLGPTNSLLDILYAISNIISDNLLFVPVVPSFLIHDDSGSLPAKVSNKTVEDNSQDNTAEYFDINYQLWRRIKETLPRMVNTVEIGSSSSSSTSYRKTRIGQNPQIHDIYTYIATANSSKKYMYSSVNERYQGKTSQMEKKEIEENDEFDDLDDSSSGGYASSEDMNPSEDIYAVDGSAGLAHESTAFTSDSYTNQYVGEIDEDQQENRRKSGDSSSTKSPWNISVRKNDYARLVRALIHSLTSAPHI